MSRRAIFIKINETLKDGDLGSEKKNVVSCLFEQLVRRLNVVLVVDIIIIDYYWYCYCYWYELLQSLQLVCNRRSKIRRSVVVDVVDGCSTILSPANSLVRDCY